MLKREPALWIAAISAVLGVIVTFGLPWLDDTDATNIVAIVTAGGAVITAIKTKPIAVSAFTGFLATAAVLAAGYGFEVPQNVLGAVQLAVVAITALVARGQITPTADPRPLHAGEVRSSAAPPLRY